MTVMGDALRDRLSDRGSIPLSSTLCIGREMLSIKRSAGYRFGIWQTFYRMGKMRVSHGFSDYAAFLQIQDRRGLRFHCVPDQAWKFRAYLLR